MKRIFALLLAAMMLLSLAACGQEVVAPTTEAPTIQTEAPAEAATEAPAEEAKPALEGQSLAIYCGAGMKQPFQEIANAFQEKTGCEMNVTFANAAQIQTQIKEAQAIWISYGYELAQ